MCHFLNNQLLSVSQVVFQHIRHLSYIEANHLIFYVSQHIRNDGYLCSVCKKIIEKCVQHLSLTLMETKGIHIFIDVDFE